jgi:hypothetical protein
MNRGSRDGCSLVSPGMAARVHPIRMWTDFSFRFVVDDLNFYRSRASARYE